MYVYFFVHFRCVGDVDDIFPKLSQYLQLAAANSKKNASQQPILISPMDIKLSPRSSPDIVQQIAAPTAQLLSALSLAPTAISSSTPTITSAASVFTTTKPATTPTSTPSATPSPPPPTQQQKKISLVPTNILMKPPSATATPPLMATALKLPTPTQIAPHHMQPQSISFGGEQYVCANTVSNGKSVYTSAQKDGQPMKVLLVNTNIQQKPPPTVSIPAGNLIMSNAVGASTSSSLSMPTIASTPTIVSSNSNPVIVTTTTTATSNSHHPIMPKPKILPASGVAPPPPVYSTRSVRAKAIQNVNGNTDGTTSATTSIVPSTTSNTVNVATPSSSSRARDALNQLHKQRTAAAVVLRQSQLNQHYQMINGTSQSKRVLIGGAGAQFKNSHHKTTS